MILHVSVVEALLSVMESSLTCKLRWPLNGDLAAAALEKPAWGESLSTDLVRRVVKFEAQHLSGRSLVHCWATTDRSEALIAASQMGLDDVVDATNARDENESTPLDCALRVGSSGVAKKLIDAGCQPTMPYIIEDCGVRLADSK